MSKSKITAGPLEARHSPTTPLPRLAYGIDEAAAALNLSRSRIYELIAEREIAACKVGKRTIIPTEELTAFLERHRVERLPHRTTAVRAAVGEKSVGSR